MAGLIGKIGEFDSATEDWTSYLERLNHYFAANGIEEEKKKDTFLCCIGRETFGLLRALVAPQKPGEKTIKELTEALTAHLAPKPLVIAERFLFHKREQKEGESIKMYAASLQKLAEHCNFGNALSDTLRDRLVCGMRDEKVQRRLLTIADLTFKKALEEAEIAERAAKEAAQFHEAEAEVHKLQRNPVQHCYRCEGSHSPQTCHFINEECRYCGKKGHIARACRARKRKGGHTKEWRDQQEKTQAVKKLEGDVKQDDGGSDEECALYAIGAHQWTTDKPAIVTVEMEGSPIQMELDTGAAVLLLPYDVYQEKFRSIPLERTRIQLRTYTGEKVKPKGQIRVNVKKGTICTRLPLVVMEGRGPPLLGRNWLSKVPIDWHDVKQLTVSDPSDKRQQHRIDALLKKYPSIQQKAIGKLANIKGRLNLKEGVAPVFLKARQVPYSLRKKVELELEKLVQEGVLIPVSWSEWATPIVVVPKADGSVRICGDFKSTLNPHLKVDQYPLPRIEDILANLGGSNTFSKIDLHLAYLQMELEEESKILATISTHRGLYRFNRLPFGVASAPAIWQRAIEQVLEGIPKTQCLLDDIIVAGSSEEEHLQLLDRVLERLNRYNLTVNRKKCSFFQKEVTYCGFRIDKEGLHKVPEKVNAVLEAPQPRNVTQLRAFLGMVNYYHRFLPNLSHKLAPLHRLLQKNIKWAWTPECVTAFQGVQQLMASDIILTHFDPNFPVTVSCDASPYGLGAVLSHVLADGAEHPVAYASRTLSPAERNYSQIDKEALAVVWGVKRFHQYLYGRRFTLVTDHKPLTSLFNPGRPMSATAASRLQRQALFLSEYSYSIQYRSTLQHANADALSRLPLEVEHRLKRMDDTDVFMLKQVDVLPVTSDRLRQATNHDPLLSKVLVFVQSGWPPGSTKELKPYFDRRLELSVEQGCLMWGIRVIVPSELQQKVLTELHSGHQGTVKMKALARSHVWWPNIDQDITLVTQGCTGCQLMQKDPKLTPVHPWEYPEGPWRRVHLDFAGPVEGQVFLVAVDAYSKWPEVVIMQDTTASTTIEELRSLFARWGIPQQLVTDNGPQFVAQEFQMFVKANNIKHVKSSPYHPATNGLAERFVQTLKRALKVSKHERRTLQHRVAQFLLSYRNAQHATTEVTPATLMVGRDLRSRLHLLRPDLRGTVLKAATRQVMTRSAATERIFYPGEKVLVRDYRQGRGPWQPAVVEEKAGTKMYVVLNDHGERWRRHSDQMKSNPCGIRTSEVEENELNGDRGIISTADGVDTAGDGGVETTMKSTSQLPQPVDQDDGPHRDTGTMVAPSTKEGGGDQS